MKLTELVRRNDWFSVQAILFKIYPEEAKSRDAYREAYQKLQETKAMQCDTVIDIVRYNDKPGEEEIVDIYGTNSNSYGNKKTAPLALEFVPWREWLGMTIPRKLLSDFNEPEIIAHCLYEMTFHGFDEEEIQAEFAAIKKSAEEIKNMTTEELKRKTISLDDLLDELDKEE